MRTELLKEDCRPLWPLSYLQEAHRAIYGTYGAQGSKRRGARAMPSHGLPHLLCEYWLLTDARRVALEVSDAAMLPAAAREVALDLVLTALDWLLALAEAMPHAHGLTKAADGKVYVYMRDACKSCGEPADYVMWPAHYPQFCDQACALTWIDRQAEDVDRFARIDDLIEEAEAKATSSAQAEAAEEAASLYAEAAEEAASLYGGQVDPDSDDNPLMRVIRLYGDDPTLTAEVAAWRLETSFRCGLRL